MPASTKRANRVKMRKSYEAHTGIVKKAKKNKFDTSGETDEVARDLGNRKKLHIHDLVGLEPLNLNQEAFLRSFYDGTDLILMKAPAGCGKTHLALHSAFSLALDESTEYDKVIIIRNTVGVRSSGYQPGDLEQKNAPYEAPFVDTCKRLFPKFKNPYHHLKSLGHLEFHSTEFLRGLNFERAIVVLDEVQNLDFGEISTVITRCSDHTKVVVCGDMRQADLNRINETSGIGRLEVLMRKMPASRSATIEFGLDDIVRGNGMVRDFLIADFNTAM